MKKEQPYFGNPRTGRRAAISFALLILSVGFIGNENLIMAGLSQATLLLSLIPQFFISGCYQHRPMNDRVTLK